MQRRAVEISTPRRGPPRSLAVAWMLLGLAACGGGSGPPSGDAALPSGTGGGPTGAGGRADASAELPEDAAAGDAGLDGMDGFDGGPGGDASGDHEMTAARCTPAGARDFFRLPAANLLDIEVTPTAGMAGLRAALLGLVGGTRPVRVRLRPGSYAPAGPGAMIEVVGLARPASAPVLVEAVDPTPDATRLGQGIRLVGASWVSFDGLTIGPGAVGAYHGSDFCQPGTCYHEPPRPLPARAGFEILGTAVDPARAGQAGGKLDFAVYGRYAPAHHIVLRRITIQNLFGDDEPSGRAAAAGSSDGIAIAHARDVVVEGGRVRQVSGHGIDLVAVHGACVLGNLVAEVGRGLGAGARAGAVDVTFDSNLFVDVARVELGGVDSDAVAHWSSEAPGTPLHYGYEGRRIIARNNVVIDGRQGAFGFAGCVDCAATGNTVVLRSGFDRGEGGGDVVREVPARLDAEGARAACLGADGVVVETCWLVGPHPPELVTLPGDAGGARVLGNQRNALGNNLFVSVDGLWGAELNPYYRPDPSQEVGFVTVDHNYWWNGPNAFTDPGDGTFLVEGAGSIFAGGGPSSVLGIDVTLAFAPGSAGLADEVRRGLGPRVESPFVGKGSATLPGYVGHDGAGATRPAPPSIGAFEPR